MKEPWSDADYADYAEVSSMTDEQLRAQLGFFLSSEYHDLTFVELGAAVLVVGRAQSTAPQSWCVLRDGEQADRPRLLI